MPLEQKDLIAIKGIVNDLLESKLSFELSPIKKDIAEIKQQFVPLQKDISDMKQHLGPMQKDIVDMKKDISETKLDVSLLAKLNQLDEIRKEPRLRTIYRNDQLEA